MWDQTYAGPLRIPMIQKVRKTLATSRRKLDSIANDGQQRQ
jgi:hypothetical protein